LKANSVNAHKKICLGVKKNRKKFKKRWKEAKKRMREEAKEREAKEKTKAPGRGRYVSFHFVFWCSSLSITHQPHPKGTDNERPWKKPKGKGTAARRTATREAEAARQNSVSFLQ